MSSDYEYSDNDDGDFYDEDDMMDTQEDDSAPSDDDMDMDAFNDDYKVNLKGKQKSYQVSSQSLSQSAVENLIQQDVEHISGIFGVDASVATLLLRHMSWNKERLIEKYMDHSSAVSIAAGVTLPEPKQEKEKARSRSPPSRTRTASRSSSKLLSISSSKSSSKSAARTTSPPAADQFVCPICFDDTPSLSTLALECGHAFCTNCWTSYVTSKVADEGEHSIRCMAETCSLVAPDTFIRTVLLEAPDEMDRSVAENKATWARFKELVVRHYVASNAQLKYCPHPGCTNTVSCPGAASRSSLTSVVPTVSCGARGTKPASALKEGEEPTGKEHVFCFGCNIESDHRPVVCGVAKMWMKKCQDDSETANWIKTNTKECTKCQSTIEKNGGCNHMTCKKCKHEFCWVCMGPWVDHGTSWYSCNRYEEKGGIDARDAQSKSRASLERYLHYYNRWANHEQSAKLSVELYAKTEKKMEDMQITSSLTWIEVQFMRKALEEVEKCRETLKWTYAMAYYLKAGNEKELFEDNQRNLEQAVEDLSELLESPIEPENISTLRQKVTDKTVYVQKRNEIVLDDTASGFLDGRWGWNVDVEGFDPAVPLPTQ